tara:strand:- start:2789 stop:3067 length:279 start_codon:yes stop_codon:yes gene_type:complete
MENKTYFFDRIMTADGYDLYWLYLREPTDYKWINGIKYPTNAIDPDDLYYNEYAFYDACEDIVMSGYNYENYAVPEELLEEWKNNLLTTKNN